MFFSIASTIEFIQSCLVVTITPLTLQTVPKKKFKKLPPKVVMPATLVVLLAWILRSRYVLNVVFKNVDDTYINSMKLLPRVVKPLVVASLKAVNVQKKLVVKAEVDLAIPILSKMLMMILKVKPKIFFCKCVYKNNNKLL